MSVSLRLPPGARSREWLLPGTRGQYGRSRSWANTTVRRPGQAMLPRVGDTFVGSVTRIVPEAEGSGGFILFRLAGMQRPVMLHCTSMTEDLRADLRRRIRGGYVQMGEEISLEVIKVDERQSKVPVKDLPDPDGELMDRLGDGGGAGDRELTCKPRAMPPSGASRRRHRSVRALPSGSRPAG